MKYKIRIERWRYMHTSNEHKVDELTYLSTVKWSSAVGTHVFAVLPWDLRDREVVIVYQNDEEVDGLTA